MPAYCRLVGETALPLPAAIPAVTVPCPTASRSASGVLVESAVLICDSVYTTGGGLFGEHRFCADMSHIILIRVVPLELRKSGWVSSVPRSRVATITPFPVSPYLPNALSACVSLLTVVSASVSGTRDPHRK